MPNCSSELKGRNVNYPRLWKRESRKFGNAGEEEMTEDSENVAKSIAPGKHGQ